MTELTLNAVTMTSVEISELTEKRHDHVMDDIRKMLSELELNAPDFSGTQKYGNNNTRDIFRLPKREVMILVSGYSIALRAKIIDRLTDLENALKFGEIPKQEGDQAKRAFELTRSAISAAEALGFSGNHAKLSADKAVKTITGFSPLALLGIELLADTRGRTYTPTELGNTFEVKLSGIKINKLLAENGLQYKDDSGEWIPTKLANELFEWVDTTRKHGDGSPVKQLRWFNDVLGKL